MTENLRAGTGPREPFFELNHGRNALRAVVLVDEIDKVDPDVPNDLLEVLGLNRFLVEEADHRVERRFFLTFGAGW